jgi:hypothetical protein
MRVRARVLFLMPPAICILCLSWAGFLVQTSAGVHVASMSYNSTQVAFGAARALTGNFYSVFFRSRGTTNPVSCYDHYVAGSRASGVYTIDRGMGPLSIFCDMTTSGGGWDLVASSSGAQITVCGRDGVGAPCYRVPCSLLGPRFSR